MNVTSVTGGESCCQKIYNNVIHPLCEKIKNFVASIWLFIKKAFATIFCCKKKKASVENINFTIDKESLKIRFSDPVLKILKNCIQNKTPYYVYCAKTFKKYDLVKKLKFNKSKKTYYVPDDLYFYDKFMNRTERGKFTTNSSIYPENEKHFFTKELLILIKTHENNIKKKNYSYKNLHPYLQFRKTGKNPPNELLNLNNNTDENKILEILFDNYDVSIIQDIFFQHRLLFFNDYLMNLCKNLAIMRLLNN